MAKYNLIGGKSKGKTLAEIAQLHGMTEKELKPQFQKGTRHELEHTNNVIVARQIALDHLVEFPDYYDRLDKIEKMKKGAVVETPATLNDIVLYYERKGNWLFAKGNFYAWLYDESGAGGKVESGEYDFIMFPPMGKGSPFSDRYVPPLLMVWQKTYQKSYKGSEHLLGIVKGFYDEDKNQLIIEMMTTNPKFRRKGVNAHIIKQLRDEFGVSQEDVIFDKPTKEGKLFESSKKYHLGGDMSQHLTPNGKPSNLTHEQWHLVRTPEFKAWFGFWDLYAYGKAKEYYEPSVRKIAKELKEEKLSAIEEVANFLSSQVTENDVLIPMPSRVGVSTDTKKLAEKISEKTGAKIFDCLIGRKRESIYELKKINEDVSHFRFEFEINCEIPKANNYFIVDNVIGTGVTMKNALKLVMDKVGDNVNPLVYAVDLKHISKVVDENGEPLVVWHGTWVENPFDVFDFDKADLGFHFGTYQQAKNRVETKMSILHRGRKPIIKPYFLNIKTLFDASDIGEWQYPQRYIDMIVDGNIITENEAKTNGFFTAYYPNDNKTIRDFIINKHGGDVGFVYENKYEAGGQSYILLQESQIKLTDGTNTTFDGNNPDIRFANGGLIAPNGKESNLTPEQYKLVRTKAFKDWFGDWENDPKNASKVVDDNGEPLVVYRGDSSESKKGFIFKKGFNRMGFINKDRLPNQYFHYFVNNYDVARGYAQDQIEDHNDKVERTGKGKIWEKKVTPYFLNIRNPIDITPNNPSFPTFEEFENELKNQLRKEWFESERYRNAWDYGKEISDSDLNKIFEDKLGKDYLEDKYIYQWQKEGFINNKINKNSYEFFIELKNMDTRSDILNQVYRSMLEKNVDGLIFLETTHYDDGFFQNWRKYQSGELKYNYERWVEKPKVFATLNSNQIKLADGTNSTFDGNNPDIRFEKGGTLDFSSSKSLSIKIDNDIYKIQYQKDELGSESNPSEKKVWFAKVISKNGKQVEGRLCYADDYVAVIYGFNLDEIKDGIMYYYQSNDLYLILQDESGKVIETTHIENDNPDIRFANGGLIAPNGKESNLTPEQYKLVRTKAFKDWFGDWENDPKNASKVVDENGEPLVVYRGSKSKNPNYIPHKHELSNGIYFSTKKEVAELYTTSVWQNWVGRVFECFLNIRNLDEYDTLQLKSNIYQADFDYYNKIVTTSYENKFDGIRWDNFIDVPDLQNIFPKEPIDFIATTFIVFEPTQIKLADGTNTTFDGNNPDIRYKRGGRTIAQTPAPKSDRVYGSKTNPKGSASDSELAKSIKFNDNLEKAIDNKVIKYNDEHPMDKVRIQTAKAVVRRGMGAYSKSHRPTISGGAPNSRQAWGLARLNKFLLKKSGVKVKSAYIQDDDLLKYAKGGQLQSDIKANAYLKPSNCTDVADVEYAFDVLRELDAKYGEDNPTLLKLWAKMLERKKYLLSKSERE
jgi:hypothetical protein